MRIRMTIVGVAALLGCGSDATGPVGATGTWQGTALGATASFTIIEKSGALEGFGSVDAPGLPSIIATDLFGVRISDSVSFTMAEGNRVVFFGGRMSGAGMTGKISGSAPFNSTGTPIVLARQ